MDTCYIKVDNDSWEEVEFMGIFQKSRVNPPSPVRGGHPGGTVSGPIAVVKVFTKEKGRTNGYLKEVSLDQLRFVE